MEDYSLANIKKYSITNDRAKLLAHSSKIIGVESFRRRCAHLASSGEKVLDIGGGSGVWTKILKEEGVQVHSYGFDLSFSMLRERRDEDVCVCGDMQSLPFKTGSFDRVLFVASLHHVRNIERALAEATRVVRSGGHVVLNEPTSLRLLLSGRKIEPVDDVEFCFSVLYLLRVLRQYGLQMVYRWHHGVFRRFLPSGSGLGLLRLADRMDEVLNKLPLVHKVGILGSSVTLVARKY